MGDPVTTAYIVGAVASVGGAVSSYTQGKDVQNEQEKTREMEQAQAAEVASRKRRQQIKKSRVERGLVENAAAGVGQSQSSAGKAGAQNVVAQAASNITGINIGERQGKNLSEQRQNVADQQGPKLAGSIFDAASGVSSLFIQSKTKP